MPACGMQKHAGADIHLDWIISRTEKKSSHIRWDIQPNFTTFFDTKSLSEEIVPLSALRSLLLWSGCGVCLYSICSSCFQNEQDQERCQVRCIFSESTVHTTGCVMMHQKDGSSQNICNKSIPYWFISPEYGLALVVLQYVFISVQVNQSTLFWSCFSDADAPGDKNSTYIHKMLSNWELGWCCSRKA